MEQQYEEFSIIGRTRLDYEGEFAIDEDPADYHPPTYAIKAVRVA